jgi:hypothetical protein
MNPTFQFFNTVTKVKPVFDERFYYVDNLGKLVWFGIVVMLINRCTFENVIE